MLAWTQGYAAQEAVNDLRAGFTPIYLDDPAGVSDFGKDQCSWTAGVDRDFIGRPIEVVNRPGLVARLDASMRSAAPTIEG